MGEVFLSQSEVLVKELPLIFRGLGFFIVWLV